MENNVKNIDYIQILKDALAITWKNKFLWWFGLLIALGGGGSSFNYNMSSNKGDEQKDPSKIIDDMNYYWSVYSEWIIFGIGVLFLIMLVFIFLGIVGRGALISSLIKLNKNEEVDFTKGFREGRKFFWKLLGMGLLIGIAVTVVILILIVPVIRLALLEAYGAAIILGIIALLIIISIIILSAFISIYSKIYLIGGGLGVISSMKAAYNIFKRNVKSSVFMGLLLLVVNIVTSILCLMVVFWICFPLAIMGVALVSMSGPVFTVTLAILSGIVLMVLAIFWRSIYVVFMQSSWILFFSKIAKVDSDIKEETLIRETVEIPQPKVI